MKQNFIFLIIVIVAFLFYALWSKGNLPGQMTKQEALPTLTTTDSTSDIEEDINSVTITDEDEGFTQVQSDLQSL